MGGSIAVVAMIGLSGFLLGGAISFGRQRKTVPAAILGVGAVVAIITAFLWARV